MIVDADNIMFVQSEYVADDYVYTLSCEYWFHVGKHQGGELLLHILSFSLSLHGVMDVHIDIADLDHHVQIN